MGDGKKRIAGDKLLVFARNTAKLRESAPCSEPSKAIFPLARPATIPRARVAETGQKRFPIIFKSKTDINRYINSESVNYVALPGGRDIGARSPRAQGARLGDLVAVINTSNYKVSFAEYADVGPRNKWGEGSIALANSLNINSSPRIGGQEDGIVYVVFPRSGSGRPLSAEEIQSIGKAKLQEWIKIQGVGNVLNK